MRSLVARFGERRLVLVGTALMAVSFLAIPAMSAVGLLLAPLLLSAVGRGISQPALMGLASFASTPQTRGAVMGTFQSRASLARAFGPFAAGLLYDQRHALPFLLAAFLMGGCLWVASRVTRDPEALPGTRPERVV